MKRLLIWIGILSCCHSQAATFFVGAGASCTHATVQAAVNAGVQIGDAFDLIKIANNLTYTSQNIAIQNRSIYLQGGYTTCSGTPDASQRATLSGAGGAADGIIKLSGTTGGLILDNLILREADQGTSGAGGGLQISGSNHSVRLSNVSIQGNNAGNGGAISIIGAQSPSNISVDLSNSVNLVSNVATNFGGAVYCQNANIVMRSLAGTVLQNSANSGGGFYLNNCALELASASFFSIASNIASSNGGGIFATGASTVEIFSLDAINRTKFSGNQANNQGGAIYLSGDATVNVHDILFQGNTALSGAVAYLFDNNGALPTALNFNATALPVGVTSACAVGEICSKLQNNRSISSDGAQSNQNAGIQVETSGGGRAALVINQISANNNQGGSLVSCVLANSASSSCALYNSEFYGNTLNNPAAALITGASLDLAHLSIGGNTLSANMVIKGVSSSTQLKMLAVNQPGKRLVEQSGGGTIVGSYLIANDLSGVPPTVNNLQADPRFISATNLRLRADSPALDYGDTATVGLISTDLEQRGRPVELAGVANEFGAVDVGAFEMTSELFFTNGFEN